MGPTPAAECRARGWGAWEGRLLMPGLGLSPSPDGTDRVRWRLGRWLSGLGALSQLQEDPASPSPAPAAVPFPFRSPAGRPTPTLPARRLGVRGVSAAAGWEGDSGIRGEAVCCLGSVPGAWAWRPGSQAVGGRRRGRGCSASPLPRLPRLPLGRSERPGEPQAPRRLRSADPGGDAAKGGARGCGPRGRGGLAPRSGAPGRGDSVHLSAPR